MLREIAKKNDLLLLTEKEHALINAYRKANDKTKRLMQLLPRLSADEIKFIKQYCEASEKLRTLIQSAAILGRDLEK